MFGLGWLGVKVWCWNFGGLSKEFLLRLRVCCFGYGMEMGVCGRKKEGRLI